MTTFETTITKNSRLCWCFDTYGSLINDSPTMIKYNTCHVHNSREAQFALWLEEEINKEQQVKQDLLKKDLFSMDINDYNELNDRLADILDNLEEILKTNGRW